MKRLLIVIVAMALETVATFPNVELDLNMYGAPLSSYTFDGGDVKVRLENPIGFDTKWGFMIGSPASFCDIGIKFSYAYDFFWNFHSSFDTPYSDFESDCDTLGFSINMTLGPLVRFNLGNWHTIYISPALMGKAFVASYESVSYKYSDDANSRHRRAASYEKTSETLFVAGAGLAFDFDIGYRVWFINIVGFHFGLDVGLDMNWPLYEKAWFDGDEFRADSGGEYKIYFGFCFNFGDKSPDKYR